MVESGASLAYERHIVELPRRPARAWTRSTGGSFDDRRLGREDEVMAVDVAVADVIEQPIDRVAAYAGDPSNAPEWYRRIESADWETEAPMRLGSRIRFRARFLGRDLEYVYEVVELTPGEQVAMRTTEGPFPMRTTYTWRPVGDRVTHMVLRNEGAPTGFAVLAAPFVSMMMRRAMTADLAALKRILES
jgi:uncharacterized membrane protein